MFCIYFNEYSRVSTLIVNLFFILFFNHSQVRGDQIGPSLVHLHFRSGLMGRGVMLQYVLPLEPMLQRIVHVFYTQPCWSPPMAKLTLYGKEKLFITY